MTYLRHAEQGKNFFDRSEGANIALLLSVMLMKVGFNTIVTAPLYFILVQNAAFKKAELSESFFGSIIRSGVASTFLGSSTKQIGKTGGRWKTKVSNDSNSGGSGVTASSSGGSSDGSTNSSSVALSTNSSTASSFVEESVEK